VKRNRLLGLAILAILGLAVLAPAGLASVTEAQPEDAGASQRAAQRQAVHAERRARHDAAAQQRAEAKARRASEIAEKKARNEAKRSARAALPHGHKVDENAEVAIGCDSITVRYFDFNAVEGSPNSVLQLIVMKSLAVGMRINFPPKTFTFEGTEATEVIPIAAPVGSSTVDLRSKWNSNENKGGFDIHESVKCEPKPGFAIEKLQSLGGPFTNEPLTGNVGQTVLYEMLITNTGNTPLTFSNFTDTVCDPGTIDGVPIAPVEPLANFAVICAHTITAADVAAGSLINIARVTGTPEEGEGSSVEHESNEVVITPKDEEKEEPEKEKEKEPEEPKGGNETPPSTPTPAPTPKSGVLGTSGASSTSSSKSGVLGFTSATVPSLRGPQGCVRSSVTASVKSAGVKSVVFYIDGHKLRAMGPSQARKGLLSIRIDVSKMKVGAHHVKATITMKPVSSGGKAAKASRSLTVVRCHSAVVTPHFTG
jgi:uncharacterized repeat protein (TIGR01451 family)